DRTAGKRPRPVAPPPHTTRALRKTSTGASEDDAHAAAWDDATSARAGRYIRCRCGLPRGASVTACSPRVSRKPILGRIREPTLAQPIRGPVLLMGSDQLF